jgi:5'-nucleotidase
MEDEKVALFDMDETLFAYTRQLRQDMLKLNAPGEPQYTVKELFDESKPWLKARMDMIKSQPGWWRSLPKLERGWTIYHLAKNIGYEVEILTKGPHSKRLAWMEKAECIDMHFGDSVTINIVGKGKGRYYGRMLVDDYPEYMNQWLQWRPRGLGIMIANEENEGYSHPNVIRFDDEDDTLEKIYDAMQAAFIREPGQHWKDRL